ncbi:RHS repeat-associated core domain-containing protein [Nocardiopsis eucommiae]|uniref:RHS repeat-associated core domain-containing protein n=1 Tax=Nocardiopsis eucommiae TaxID=2831970 RepID=UPI003D73E6C1
MRTVVATTAAATLTLGLLSAPPAWADEGPHSPADRTVPIPETWEPGEANTDPRGGDPPEVPWTPPGSDPEARTAEDPEALVGTCADGINRGIQPWYPLERHQISDRLEMAVNTNNGNLVVQHRDLTVAGTGLDLSVSSFYNSARSYDGWTQTHGRHVGLNIFSDSIIFQGPSGYCERFDIDQEDGSFISPAGLNADLVELDNGHYALTFHRGEHEDQVWTFTAQGWWYSQADRNGNTHRLRYDSEGHLASIVDTQDRVTSFDWQGSEFEPELVEITDPVGQSATVQEWEGGQLVGLVDRAGDELAFDYTDSGQLTSITDATGATWSVGYNDDGQVSSLTVPDGSEGGASTFYAYDATFANTETVVSDPNGGESTFTFDDQGRQTEAVDQVGNTRSQTWTANSDVASTTDALEASVTYDFDEFNNLIGTELPTGAATSVGFADTANPAKPTSVTTPSGDELSLSYDDAGNLTRAVQEDMDIDVTSLSYTGQGLVSSVTDANGNETTFSYDSVGNLTEMAEPGPIGATTFGYDSLSRVTSVTDGNGTRLDYGYDRLDRIVSISHDGDVLQSIEYDGNGRQTATHTDQATTTWSYNGRGDLNASERTDSTGTEATSYTHDAAGNVTSITEHGNTTTYAYDAAFRLTSLVDHTGAETTFSSDANNRRTSIVHPDGAEEARSYDASGRLTSITTTGAADQTLVEASYTWGTAEGEDSAQLQSRTVNGETENFTYDGLQRLTSNGTVDYTYDDVGNLLEAGEEEFSYNDADQPTTARGEDVAHDEAGNMTGRGEYVYEYSVTKQNTRIDDGDGDLAAWLSYDTTDQTQMRGVTDVHDGDRIERQLSNTALGVTNIASEGERTSFVRDPNGELISMVAWDGDERFHYTLDHQNTVLALTAEGSEADAPDAVYAYSPYGEQNSDTLEDTRAGELNPFGYTGAYQFQDGTVHLSHRFYDTFTLGFTQPDPSRQELNNHTYAACDPINNTDPTGLQSYGACMLENIVVGFAVGGMVGMGWGAVAGAVGGSILGPAGTLAGGVGGASVGMLYGVAQGAIGGVVTGALMC